MRRKLWRLATVVGVVLLLVVPAVGIWWSEGLARVAAIYGAGAAFFGLLYFFGWMFLGRR